MKKWKLIRCLTIIFFIILFFYIFFVAYSSYQSNVVYPCEKLGVIVYNWFENFGIEIALRLYILLIPIIINLVLMIMSIFKIKHYKINNLNCKNKSIS